MAKDEQETREHGHCGLVMFSGMGDHRFEDEAGNLPFSFTISCKQPEATRWVQQSLEYLPPSILPDHDPMTQMKRTRHRHLEEL